MTTATQTEPIKTMKLYTDVDRVFNELPAIPEIPLNSVGKTTQLKRSAENKREKGGKWAKGKRECASKTAERQPK